MMQKHKKMSARILSMALSVAMVTTMLPMTVFAVEGDLPLGASSVGGSDIGTIQSFDKLEDRFIPSVGKDAPSHIYGLTVELNTSATDLNLPTELTAMVARTTTVQRPAEDVPVVDSGKPSEPAEDEVVPDEDEVGDDTVSGNEPASPSEAKKEVKEEIKDGDVPLAPEPEQDEETIPVTWNSNKEYKSDENGKFIYTAEIPEDYILAAGVKLPQIYVVVGKLGRAARTNAITVEINNRTATGDTSLGSAISASRLSDAEVTSLKITEGTVTENDWKYLKNLTALTNFEIDGAVIDVAEMPDPRYDASLFPKSIVTVTVPQAIKISNYAFQRCSALTSASFPAATGIGTFAFTGTSITSVSFPEVTSSSDAFWGCSALTSVSLPKLTDISSMMFADCSALTSVSFPAVTSIGSGAFDRCTELTTASFPAVTQIGNNVFSSCAKLVTLNLGATPPATVSATAFVGVTPCDLGYVDAGGTALTGDALTNAQVAYKAVNDSAMSGEAAGNGTWYGWTIGGVAPPIGGGGSSSGGGNSYVYSLPKDYAGAKKVLHNNIVPDYVVEGAWVAEGNGKWKLVGPSGSNYVDTWVPAYNPYADVAAGQSAFDWFLFDKEGYLVTGWYTDSQGQTYYLNPASNNIKGGMATGWVQIEGKYYYFNDKSDGTRGKLYRSATTPDGYYVDENGAWNGKVK